MKIIDSMLVTRTENRLMRNSFANLMAIKAEALSLSEDLKLMKPL
jgi:hypothetical protein